jgi:hypothetical protein
MSESEDYTLGTYSQLAEAAEKKQQPSSPAPVSQPQEQPLAVVKPAKKAVTTSGNDDTVVSRYHATTRPRTQVTTAASGDDDMLEDIRKAVKQIGEKAATYRFTAAEKEALADIVYAWKKKGFTTSENEISRIAINYIMLDYHKNKQASIIAQVLERLNG